MSLEESLKVFDTIPDFAEIVKKDDAIRAFCLWLTRDSSEKFDTYFAEYLIRYIKTGILEKDPRRYGSSFPQTRSPFQQVEFKSIE